MLHRPQITLSEFAEIVADPKRWPAGFVWNYASHETCAVGLFWAVIAVMFVIGLVVVGILALMGKL